MAADPLVDTDGDAYSLADSTDKRLTLVFFGYTNCPDICGTVMGNLASAMTRLDSKDRDQVDVVFVTTDVKRDTPPVLGRWLQNFANLSPKGVKFIGLTGTQPQIDAAQAAAHVIVAEDNGQTHSSKLLLYGPDDYARIAFLESTMLSKQVSHDLPIIAKS